MRDAWRDRLRAGLRRLPGFRQARFVYQLARGASSRSVALLLWRQPDLVFQPHPTTSENRYPELFALARERIGDGPDRRILSFGCSTGDEVWSLRRYFATAEIVGIDINPHNIKVCRARLRSRPDAHLRFEVAGSTDGHAAESFDAIFAMAVFRCGALNVSPPPPRCTPLIRFAHFDAAIAGLARCLKPGGLLFVAHAQFRVSDTTAYRDFEVVVNSPGRSARQIYGPDDRLLPGEVYGERAFRKKERCR